MTSDVLQQRRLQSSETYATSTNPAAALDYARKAVAAEKDHPNPNYLDTLAEALYLNQQYADAVNTEQQALQLATPEFVSPQDRPDFQKRLEKYQLALKDSMHSASGKPPKR